MPRIFLDKLLFSCPLRLQIITGTEEFSFSPRRHYASAKIKGPDTKLRLCGIEIYRSTEKWVKLHERERERKD
jgi:hypothetical protein